MSNLLEQIKMVEQLVENISSSEEFKRQYCIDDIAKAYYNLQQSMYGLIDEHGYILQNFKWALMSHTWNFKKIDLDSFIEKLSTDFCFSYGFSKDIVIEILNSKNQYESYYKTNYVKIGHSYEPKFKLNYYMLVPKK